MRSSMIVAVVASALLLCGSLSHAQERIWITISAAGNERGAFVPRHIPYTQDGPSVGVYLYDRQDVRMPDGKALTGFDFIGWSEGGATRIQVFALVPRDDVPNAYMPGGDSRNLVRRDFGSYLVRSDESQPIVEMRALGIEPMTLGTVVRGTAAR